ncbi:NAD-dependent epimerase/dehydratase family protein [Rhodococcus qingshengii]|uniref:NAD-dependent epimerase/dehydratase family protein n=1 Tax=Rhodococcus qingshengii TaxID=334542 RepID=UPI00279FED95|nr:NAD-dependent epimerase/dehydratase family protein [Rhodococcus qingshengii]
MAKVVIAGGTGALGRRISDDLADRGYDVVVLTRSPKPGRHRQVQWDGVTVGDWARELDGAAVINLAGELVDRRPTPANIALLTNSRVDPTRALVEASKLLANPVPVWIQASTLAIYGDAGETRLDEASPLADGPPQMTDVAKDWEAAVEGANTSRVVILRTSVVLEKGTPRSSDCCCSCVSDWADASPRVGSGPVGFTSRTGCRSCAGHSNPIRLPRAWSSRLLRIPSETQN